MNQAIDEWNKGNTKIGDELAWKVNEILFPTFKGNLTGPQPSSLEEQNLINEGILANRKARTVRDLSHLKKAQKLMNEACEKNPFYRTHYVYLYEKGRILARLKRYDETISCYEASKKYQKNPGPAFWHEYTVELWDYGKKKILVQSWSMRKKYKKDSIKIQEKNLILNK